MLGREAKTDPKSVDPIVFECIDISGRELFPADDIAAICDLVPMLDSGLDLSEKQKRYIPKDIDHMSLILENTHNGVRRLLRDSGLDHFKKQSQLKETVATRAERDNPTLVLNMLKIREAIEGLVPETEYFKSIFFRQKGDLSEDDYLQAPEGAQVGLFSRIIQGTPRLQENTPKNLEELIEITGLYSNLVLLETQALGAQLLATVMAYGNRKDINTAANILKRFKNIACDEEKDALAKISGQQSANKATVELLASVIDRNIEGKTKPEIEKYARMLTEALTNIGDAHELTVNVLHHIIIGRELRLNGGRTAEEKPLPGPTPIVAPEAAEAKKPEPDFLGQYTARLRVLLATCNLPQPDFLAAKEIKRRKLDEARAVLVKGEEDGDGNTLIAGRSKTAAQQLISHIEFLRTFIPDGGDMDAAKERLDQAVAESTGFTTQLSSLFDAARERLSPKALDELKGSSPNIQSLDSLLSSVREEWDTVSLIVREHWPDDSREAAQQLKHLLFPSDKGGNGSSEESSAIAEAQPADLPADKFVHIDRKEPDAAAS